MTSSAAEPVVSAYYPALQLDDDLVILACDWIARYLKGGEPKRNHLVERANEIPRPGLLG